METEKPKMRLITLSPDDIERIVGEDGKVHTIIHIPPAELTIEGMTEESEEADLVEE